MRLSYIVGIFSGFLFTRIYIVWASVAGVAGDGGQGGAEAPRRAASGRERASFGPCFCRLLKWIGFISSWFSFCAHMPWSKPSQISPEVTECLGLPSCCVHKQTLSDVDRDGTQTGACLRIEEWSNVAREKDVPLGQAARSQAQPLWAAKAEKPVKKAGPPPHPAQPQFTKARSNAVETHPIHRAFWMSADLDHKPATRASSSETSKLCSDALGVTGTRLPSQSTSPEQRTTSPCADPGFSMLQRVVPGRIISSSCRVVAQHVPQRIVV